jgi:hypothetical protein
MGCGRRWPPIRVNVPGFLVEHFRQAGVPVLQRLTESPEDVQPKGPEQFE